MTQEARNMGKTFADKATYAFWLVLNIAVLGLVLVYVVPIWWKIVFGIAEGIPLLGCTPIPAGGLLIPPYLILRFMWEMITFKMRPVGLD